MTYKFAPAHQEDTSDTEPGWWQRLRANTFSGPMTFNISFDPGVWPSQADVRETYRRVLDSQPPATFERKVLGRRPPHPYQEAANRNTTSNTLDVVRGLELARSIFRRRQEQSGFLMQEDLRVRTGKTSALLAVVKTVRGRAPVGCLLEVSSPGYFEKLFATPDLDQHIEADLRPGGLTNYMKLAMLLNRGQGFKALLVSPGAAETAPAPATEPEVWFVMPQDQRDKGVWGPAEDRYDFEEEP